MTPIGNQCPATFELDPVSLEIVGGEHESSAEVTIQPGKIASALGIRFGADWMDDLGDWHLCAHCGALFWKECE